MNQEELLYIGGVWNDYFPRDVFIAQDPRLGGIAIFRDFFRSREGQCFIGVDDLSTQKYVYFNTIQLGEALPFDDFELSLTMRPTEVMGFIGIALSLIAHAENPHCQEPFIIRPRFYELSIESGFGDIKSSKVGQVVSVRGHVVRVSPCKPLVLSAQFLCAKCMSYTSAKFEDGIFLPPVICGTEKCYNKYLELDRCSVTTSDYQRVKLTELDEVAQQEVQGLHGSSDSTSAAAASLAAATARVPRTLEVEVRDTLVNTCVPGDLLSVVGIVKSVQTEAPRSTGGKGGGYKESGLHVLYLLANSLLCLKGSGDRGNPHSRQVRAASRSTATHNVESSVTEPLTLLDEQAPQSITQHATMTAGNSNSTGSSSTGSTTRDSAFTETELAAIRSLALSDQAFPLLIHSLCPTIFGQELVKAGLLLSLFGGSRYAARGEQCSAAQSTGTSRARTGRDFHVRPDIHVLVVGDPGLGKSQMLRAAATVAPRAVFVCGNTSTAAGLTVSVSRDASAGGKGGGELCIEAGALILADQGVCCIDELDKITSDQHALLEAMEQQSVSIAKSGVVTSLKSRTSVLAAANPAGGHYNRKKSVCENLKMNAALLSRFDLIFILLDRPDERHDRMVGEHIMQMQRQQQPAASSYTESHKRARESWEDSDTNAIRSGRPEEELVGATLQQRLRRNIQSALRCQEHSGGIVGVELMRRYIEYARRYVQPSLTPGAAKVLQRLYLTMRAEASAGQSIPVTTRHLESLIRLAQARARIDLRDEVTAADAQDVVQLLQESLLDVYTDEVGAIDSSRKGGISLAKQVKALVKVMTRESTLRSSTMFTRQDILALCQKLALDKEVDSLIDVMRTECYLLLKGPRTYQLQTA